MVTNENSKLVILIFIMSLIVTLISPQIINCRIEKMTGDSSSVSDCQRSIQDFNDALQAQKKQDQDNYNAAVNDWSAKKSAFQSSFTASPALWRKYCSDGSCDIDAFFTKYPQSVIDGYDLQNSIRTDVSGCLQACLNRDDCHWAQYRNGECWIKGALNDSNSDSYVKTNTGWRNIDNLVFHGMDVRQYNQYFGSPENPANIPSDIGGDFNLLTVSKDGRYSGYKDINRNRSDADTYFKNKLSSYTFPDNSPIIINNIGPKPSMQHTPVELSVVCQDCRQALGQTQVTDSTQVNMSQFNQCIANLQSKAPPTTETSNTPTNNTPTNNPTTNNPTTNTPNTENNTSNTSNSGILSNKGFLIGGGVSLVLTVIVIIVIVVISKRNSA